MTTLAEIFESVKKAEAEAEQDLARIWLEPTKPKIEDGRLVFEREERELVRTSCL